MNLQMDIILLKLTNQDITVIKNWKTFNMIEAICKVSLLNK